MIIRVLPRLVHWVFLTSILAGCASNALLQESRTTSNPTRPFRRMLVVSAVHDDGRNSAFPKLIAAGYRRAAARCGVEAEVVNETLDGRPAVPLHDASTGIRLAVIPRVIFGEQKRMYLYSSLAGYVATLSDEGAGLELWKASFNISLSLFRPSTDSDMLAAEFPDMLFTRMEQDGILHGCATPEKGASTDKQ